MNKVHRTIEHNGFRYEIRNGWNSGYLAFVGKMDASGKVKHFRAISHDCTMAVALECVKKHQELVVKHGLKG